MNHANPTSSGLPTPEQVHTALEIYLRHAYGAEPSEAAQRLLPPEGDFNVADWFTGEMVERDPDTEDLASLRSVAFRFGNMLYPNMKLRLCRAPGESEFVFTVDSHDAMLQAPEGSQDHAMLEELKAHNARVGDAILKDWNAAGLPTERSFLRRKIDQARKNSPQRNPDGNAP